MDKRVLGRTPRRRPAVSLHLNHLCDTVRRLCLDLCRIHISILAVVASEMACYSAQKRSNVQTKIQLEVDRMLYVRNLPYEITEAQMHAVFGKYGPVDSIRIGGTTAEAEGTAFVVYQDAFCAQRAYERSKGVKVGDRYPLILYYRNRVSCQHSDAAAADKLRRKREKMGRIGYRPKLILSDD